MTTSFHQLLVNLLACCALAADTAAVAAHITPDPQHTPGAINPGVRQQNISSTICARGYTRSIRPPFEYTNPLKRRLVREAGLPPAAIRDYELDHLIPLELGGAPYDTRNLWLESWAGDYGAARKDDLERRLHDLVCAYRLRLVDAQHVIATDWVQAYRTYMRPSPEIPQH
jgi:hypothetical protein